MKCRFRSFFFFLISSAALLTAHLQTDLSFAAINPTDQAALVALYNSTNGAGWINRTGWENYATTNPCDTLWYGVTCNGERVASIVLDGNGLSGPLPSEIGNLEGAQTLSLSNNNLTGSIPASLGNLGTNLLNLYLDGNNLTGDIPPELGSLSSLQTLALYNNSLAGIIPSEIGNLSSILNLVLYGNSLTGRIPSTLGNLTTLNKLYIDQNNLYGNIPSAFTKLINLDPLTGLDISNNNLCTDVDNGLAAFIDSKNSGWGDWKATQTPKGCFAWHMFLPAFTGGGR